MYRRGVSVTLMVSYQARLVCRRLAEFTSDGPLVEQACSRAEAERRPIALMDKPPLFGTSLQ
ncbi:hypothetical protein EYF80_066825 [Liparis tanakae]|uniref:Uncharacterized protein n=1 Tax=Liparis tanakae TaxID=230148 RepID=A0A4Z2E2S2_9TELE|nr:hypothetical protein EYF80_066825 [Liparis tanakae]